MMNTAPLGRISPFFNPEANHEPPSSSRGDEAMGTVWSYLDAAPLGRQEVWEDSPAGYPQTPPYKWWNWHDNYEAEKSGRPAMVQELSYVRKSGRAEEDTVTRSEFDGRLHPAWCEARSISTSW